MTAVEQPPPGPRRVVVALDLQVIVSIVVAALVAYALFAIASDASSMFTLLAIGFVLALALDGVVGKLSARFSWSRGVAVATVTLVLFGVATLIVLVLGPPAVSQAQDFATTLPQTVTDLYTLPVVGSFLENADAATKVEQFIADLPATISTDTVTSVAQTLLGGLVNVTIVLATTFAVLLDGERLVSLFRRAIPERLHPRADRAGRVFYQIVGRYFGGSLTVAVMMGLYVLTISLTFGVPLAPLAAIWAMLTDLVPQVGGFLGGAFLTILALAAGPGTAVIVLILFLIYMNVENNFIQPAVIGGGVNLSPPTTMVAALVGGAAAGIPGAIVATPLVGAIKELWFEFKDPNRTIEATPSALGKQLERLRRRRVERTVARDERSVG